MPPETGNPRLSRFNPLRRVLAFDDFDEGTNGWCDLVANHDPPQLSNCTFFDTGTQGAAWGSYALKLATRPKPDHTAAAIRRLTFAKRGLVQLETYFTYKSEQTGSELDFGDITFSNDISEGERGLRYRSALRYANTGPDGKLLQRWQHNTSIQAAHPDDWGDIGHQPLCYNDTSTKVNWHYLRWLFDTGARRSVEFESNGLVMDLRDIAVPMYDHGSRALSQMLNFVIDVRTRTGVRNFLYLDSALISVDW